MRLIESNYKPDSLYDVIRRATFDQLSRIIVSLKLQYCPTFDVLKPYEKKCKAVIVRFEDLVFATPITHAVYQPNICEPKTYSFSTRLL